MSAGSTQKNGVIGVIQVIGVIDAELSGLQMGNPNNSRTNNPVNPINPKVITLETPLRASSSNPSIIAHLVTLNNSITPITLH